MFVDESYRRNVGYFVAEEWDEPGQQWFLVPQGAVFFLHLPVESYGLAYYAVTARHIVETTNSQTTKYAHTFLRVNTGNGNNARDWPVSYSDWIFHPTADVAVCKVVFLPNPNVFSMPFVAGFGQVVLGHDVFFVGLFDPVPGKEAVDAVVRFGRVAQPRARVPIILNRFTEERHEADVHLVECISWGGESGSPVFFYEQQYSVGGLPDSFSGESLRVTPSVRPGLLGLMHGHFPIEGANSGIAAVIPAREIHTTLMDRRLVEDREDMLQVAKTKQSKLGTPTPDVK